jgi:RNA processing factor Prp31
MSEIVYVIKNKNNFPRIISEVYNSDELLAEYEVALSEVVDKVEISLIQQYSNELESGFDQMILDMKNEGLNSNSLIVRLADITELLRIKTQCDEYIERMDIVE